METVTLNNGVEMPILGFGVYQIPGDQTQEAVEAALAAGYRHLDTAASYGNEEAVGAAIKAVGLPREELFVTTKLWIQHNPTGTVEDDTRRAFASSLARLGLDRVDLYLIHWPIPSRDRYVETWKALGRIHGDGRARAIGVSNFEIPHLLRLFDETSVVPAVNQVELHPRLAQRDLRAFHAEHGILTEAWSPLAQGAVLDDPAIVEIADRRGKTPAQVVLRWHLQLGNVVIPKSVTPARVAENIALFDFELRDDELAAIDRLDAGGRIGPDPERFAG